MVSNISNIHERPQESSLRTRYLTIAHHQTADLSSKGQVKEEKHNEEVWSNNNKALQIPPKDLQTPWGFGKRSFGWSSCKDDRNNSLTFQSLPGAVKVRRSAVVVMWGGGRWGLQVNLAQNYENSVALWTQNGAVLFLHCHLQTKPWGSSLAAEVLVEAESLLFSNWDGNLRGCRAN